MGLAGIILFLTPAVGIPIILFLAIALSIFYLITSLRIRNLYKPSLVQLLREGQQEFFGHEDLDESGNFSGGSGTDEAINVALVGLKDPYEGSRRLSAELLGRMARPEVVPFLITAISNDKSPDVRRACIVALSQLSGQDAFHSIAQHLADPDAGVRAQAAASLRNTGAELEQMSLFFLRRALNDQNPVVCREAIFTISAYGYHKEALYALWEMGRHPEMEVRAEAAIAYGVIGEQDDPLILKELLILLRDSDSIVRAKAARAISRFSDPKAVNALIYTLEDESPAVREEAAHSLARMHQVSASTILRYLAISINENGQHAALRTLTLARLDYLDSSRTLLPERSGEVVSQDLKIEPPVKSGKLVIDEIKYKKLVEYGKRQLEIARRMSDYLRSLGKLDMNSTAWRTNGRRPKRDPANLALLQKSLRARYQSAVDRLIAVVGLLGNVEAIELAGENLRNRAERDASRKRADAIETFENFGDDYLTPALISLLEEDEQGEAALPSKPRTLAETLYEIWLENDRWLRACILHVIGLFSLNKLKPLVLDALKLDPTKEQLIYESALEAQQNLDLTTDNNNSENSMQTLTSLSTLSRILFLQKVPIFSSLSPEDLRRVAVVSDERLYTPGEFLCYEGEAGDELYIIVSGQVQVLAGYTGKTDEPATNVKTLYTATEGEVLGEMAILEDIPRTATLRAYNAPVRILALGGIEFKRILRERPELAIEIIRVLSRWLRETNRRVQNAPSLEEAPAS
jgi:CRP/FNR family transcriptional regulator